MPGRERDGPKTPKISCVQLFFILKKKNRENAESKCEMQKR